MSLIQMLAPIARCSFCQQTGAPVAFSLARLFCPPSERRTRIDCNLVTMPRTTVKRARAPWLYGAFNVVRMPSVTVEITRRMFTINLMNIRRKISCAVYYLLCAGREDECIAKKRERGRERGIEME